MEEKDKKLLIVDDSEIDRTILKNILQDEFHIAETDNGYGALEIIRKTKGELDAVLLDVSMPQITGFDVLKLMRESNIDQIPVFLITSEATKDNVLHAAEFDVAEFIRKPFDREDILRRLKARLGVIPKTPLSNADMMETNKYIADLRALYNQYLSNTGRSSTHYSRMTDLMSILLKRYTAATPDAGLNNVKIKIISNAAYFCDIGYMLLPDNREHQPEKSKKQGSDLYQSHTVLGAGLIRLNYSKGCEYFVQICADMCAHHHERYDGKGFPHGVSGVKYSDFSQMCRLADEFDNFFCRRPEQNEPQFHLAINELKADKGAVSLTLLSLLLDSKADILTLYSTNA